MSKAKGTFCFLLCTGIAVGMCYAGYMVRLQGHPGSGWAFLAMGLYPGIVIAALAHVITWRWLADTGHNVAIGLLAYLWYYHWEPVSHLGQIWWLSLCMMAPSLVFFSGIVYRTTRGRGD